MPIYKSHFFEEKNKVTVRQTQLDCLKKPNKCKTVLPFISQWKKWTVPVNVRSACFCWDSVISAAPWQLDYFPFSPLCPLQSQPPIFSSFSLSAFLSALCHCSFYTSPFMWGSVERSQPHGSNQGGWMSWKPSTENYFKMSISYQMIHQPANQYLKKKHKKNTSKVIQILSHV